MLKYLLMLIACVVSNGVPNEFVQTLNVPGLYGKPSDLTYSLPQIDDVSVLLSIKGKHDARVWLCPDNSTNNCIEVLFGYTSNRYVTIRDNWYITETSTFISPLYHGNVLDEDQYRPFWINWVDKEMSVGFGHEIYKNLILAYREDSFIIKKNITTPPHSYRLSTIRFSSWEKPIQFLFYINRGFRHPYPTFSTSSDYEQFGQSKKLLQLSTVSFEIIIECQGLSECNMAFLQSYHWKTEDTKAVEIVLHDAFERRHLYFRNIIRYGTGLGGMILSESNKTVLYSNEFRPFWIKWKRESSLISIGEGIDIGKNILLKATTSFSSSFVYMGFSNYFLATSVRILYASSKDDILYDFDKTMYHFIKKMESDNENPLTFSHGMDSVNKGFRVSKVEQECPRLTRCQPPLYPYKIKLPVSPRVQWWHNGAYCAEVSIQTALLGKGVYMSQAWIRKHSPYSGNPAFFGDKTFGYEIVPGNIEKDLQRLHVSYERWKGSDIKRFFGWIKKNIIKGHPILWFVQGAESTYVEHAEIISGYFSRYPSSTSFAYPDDMIRYHNNIELLSYYRRIDSFVDIGNKKNCTNGSSLGTECISPGYQFAIAIKNIKDDDEDDISLHLQLSDGGMESLKKVWINVTVFIKNIEKNTRYKITRYTSKSKTEYFFISNQNTFTWNDPIPVLSSLYVYYTCRGIKNL
jgi:hypothetical protein